MRDGSLRITADGGMQEFAVGGLEAVLFVVSEGADEKTDEWAVEFVWETVADANLPSQRSGDFYLRPSPSRLEDMVGSLTLPSSGRPKGALRPLCAAAHVKPWVAHAHSSRNANRS